MRQAGFHLSKTPQHVSADYSVKGWRFLKDGENLNGAVHSIAPRLPYSRDNAQRLQPVDSPLGRRVCHLKSGGQTAHRPERVLSKEIEYLFWEARSAGGEFVSPSSEQVVYSLNAIDSVLRPG